MHSARAQSALRHFLVFALPSLATLGRFRNGFVFDDVFVIERGKFIHDLANLPGAFTAHAMIASSQEHAVGRPGMDTYRPISIASFFWDAALSGTQTWSYHLTNMMLHGLVCVLVLRLLDLLLPQVAPGVRLFLTCCFGLAPWLSEAHVFINGRSDLCLALFFLTALLAFRDALDRTSRTMGWLAAASLLAALLSKEVAVVLLPFVLAFPASGVPWRKRLALGAPLCVALAAYLVLRFNALDGLRSHNDAGQMLLALKQLPLLLADGVAHALTPTPYFLRSLNDDYAHTSTSIICLSAAALLIVCVSLVVMSRRYYTFSWAVFLALTALAPCAMISTTLWPGFGRYLYVPAIGLCVAAGVGIGHFGQRIPIRRSVWTAAGVSLALASAALLVDATFAFESERIMYARSISQRPQQAWTHGFMGMSLRRAGLCDEAIPYLNRAATMAPADPRYSVHLGRCLVDIGAYQAAVGVAERGRERFRDTRAECGFLLVAVLAMPSARAQEQEELLRRCLRLDTGRSDCAELLQRVQAFRTGAPALPGGP